MSSSIRWQSVNFSSLRIEEWDGEYTMFQPEAGKTHFLNQMSMKIITYLSQAPASTDEICHTLAVKFQLTSDTTFSRNIDNTLHHFDALGLIKKVK